MGRLAIDGNSLVAAVSDHLLAEFDDAAVILHLPSGQYFSLSGSGGRIWQLLQQPVRVTSLVEQLVADFEVDSTRCLADTLSLLEQLNREGLLTVRPALG